MTARCASCNYPLTISDSVVCYECTSYFHIDCAQLVGFPFYPQSNTFHCSTCKHLPLPRRAADSDSDSDSEGGDMPSRQLDYNMEDRPDFTNDLNEVKGSVQDLSSLCKDMLREINELKSINLTLRCSVENLRHDSNRRDGLIADLQLRIEALEKNKSNRSNVAEEPADRSLDRIVLEKEDELERYSTPEPPDVNNEMRRAKNSSPVNGKYLHETFPHVKYDECKTTEDEIDENKIENNTLSENILSNREPNVQDWTWKGNDAIEINKVDNAYQGEINESDDDQNGRYDGDDQELNDNVEEDVIELREKIVQKRSTDAFEYQSNNDEDDDDEEESEEEEKTQYDVDEMKLFKRNMGNDEETLDEGIENYEDEDSKIKLSDSTDSKPAHLPNDEISQEEVRTELGSDVESIATFDERDLTERLHMEGLSAIDESSPADDQTEVQEPRLTKQHTHEDDWQPTEGEVDKPDTGDEDIHDEGECNLGEIEPRLESEIHRDLESAELGEGDVEMIGEEHPEALEGEDHGFEPSEDIEIVEPPAEPQHSESDLWDYLKDTVSSVHPSTVEEFLENLIGTLQHVPEEYFKPVIEANIRRATSPSVTDGEHLPSHDETHEVGESTEIMDSHEQPIEEESQEPADLQAEDGYTPVEVSD